MKIGAEMTNLLSSAQGAEPPKQIGEQIEYMFAQQLVHALTESSSLSEDAGPSYLSLLDDHLARQMSQGGALGIAQQLGLGSGQTMDGQP